MVITALGIKREEKALGYSVQGIKGSEVAKVKAVNIVSALSGKVSGVNITNGAGGPGELKHLSTRRKRNQPRFPE